MLPLWYSLSYTTTPNSEFTHIIIWYILAYIVHGLTAIALGKHCKPKIMFSDELPFINSYLEHVLWLFLEIKLGYKYHCDCFSNLSIFVISGDICASRHIVAALAYIIASLPTINLADLDVCMWEYDFKIVSVGIVSYSPHKKKRKHRKIGLKMVKLKTLHFFLFYEICQKATAPRIIGCQWFDWLCQKWPEVMA